MFCKNCGKELAAGATVCPLCGSTVLPEGTPAAVGAMPGSDIANRVLGMVRDPLYLAVCILESVSCISILKGQWPLLNILLAIFLWIAYAHLRKNPTEFQPIRNISGLVFAYRVILWVAFGLIMLAGVLTVAFGLLATGTEWQNWVQEWLSSAPIQGNGLSALFAGSMAIVGILVLFVGIILLLINQLGMRSIHRFTRSLYQSVECGRMTVQSRRAAQGWLLAFGVINVLSLLIGGTGGLLTGGAGAAALICAGVLVGRHFSDCE